VLVSPARWRPLVAGLGAVFVLAVSFSLLLLAWHMPSDVIGGFLLSGFTTAATVIAVIASERHAVGVERLAGAARIVREARRLPAPRPARRPAGAHTQVPAATVALVLAGLLAVLAARPGQAAGFAAAHHSLVAFAAMIAALAVALVSGAAAGLRR